MNILGVVGLVIAAIAMLMLSGTLKIGATTVSKAKESATSKCSTCPTGDYSDEETILMDDDINAGDTALSEMPDDSKLAAWTKAVRDNASLTGEERLGKWSKIPSTAALMSYAQDLAHRKIVEDREKWGWKVTVPGDLEFNPNDPYGRIGLTQSTDHRYSVYNALGMANPCTLVILNSSAANGQELPPDVRLLMADTLARAANAWFGTPLGEFGHLNEKEIEEAEFLEKRYWNSTPRTQENLDKKKLYNVYREAMNAMNDKAEKQRLFDEYTKERDRLFGAPSTGCKPCGTDVQDYENQMRKDPKWAGLFATNTKVGQPSRHSSQSGDHNDDEGGSKSGVSNEEFFGSIREGDLF